MSPEADGLSPSRSPVPRRPVSSEELVRRAAQLPHVDPAELRTDIDAIVDMRLYLDDE
jgi:hypothetical protein